MKLKRNYSGYTLVEVMVVVGVIAILAGVIIFNVSAANQTGRDKLRQADLREMQNAIERYKLRYGRYPAGCNGGGVESGGTYLCDDLTINNYVIGLAPAFINVLPRDPKLGAGGDRGYIYIANDAGTVYKLIAMNTVESETVEEGHEFASCPASCPTTGDCDPDSSRFKISYAVWGGYAEADATGGVVTNTDEIVCK